jgi:hypothetical protein
MLWGNNIGAAHYRVTSNSGVNALINIQNPLSKSIQL